MYMLCLRFGSTEVVTQQLVKHGLRPCISLKSDIIRITGGDGTSEATAYTLGI